MPIDENGGTPGGPSSTPEGHGASGQLHPEGHGTSGQPHAGASHEVPVQPPEAVASGAPAHASAAEPRPPTPPLGPSIEPAARLGAPAVPRHPEPQWIDLSTLVDSDSHRFRPPEEIAPLAESIARQGQRTPIDVRPVAGGYQVVSGHRRLEAVRLLHRSRILARVHPHLNDDDALYLSVSDDLDRRPWSADERAALQAQLERRGLFSARMRALLERAAAQAHLDAVAEPDEAGDEEVEVDELAQSVRDRLADACNDLSALYELWGDLDEGRREDLVVCVRYLKDLHPFLEGSEEET